MSSRALSLSTNDRRGRPTSAPVRRPIADESLLVGIERSIQCGNPRLGTRCCQAPPEVPKHSGKSGCPELSGPPRRERPRVPGGLGQPRPVPAAALQFGQQPVDFRLLDDRDVKPLPRQGVRQPGIPVGSGCALVPAGSAGIAAGAIGPGSGVARAVWRAHSPWSAVGRAHSPSSTAPASTRAGSSASRSCTRPLMRTPPPKVQSPRTTSLSASTSEGAPSGKRCSKSPSRL